MKRIDCTNLFLPFLCRELNYLPTPFAQCITCTENGVPVAGVIYDGFNQVSIGAHIWISKEKRPSKEWYVAIFDYPFNRLCITKLVGQVPSSKEEAVRLDQHFGFVEEARVKDYSKDGDLIIYTMTKDQCRILNSEKWSNVVSFIRRVA